MEEPILVRYDQCHFGTCHVYRQNEPDTTLTLDQRFFGFHVSTSDPDIASVFGIATVDDQTLVKHFNNATLAGDLLFGMNHGVENHRHWFLLNNYLSLTQGVLNSAGFIRWSKEAWQKINTAPFERIEVVRTLREIVEDRFQAVLNRELFMAVVDSDTGERVCFKDYLTPEDALSEAQLQFPDIKYREEDFVIQYRVA